MNRVFFDLLDKGVLVYLDDILIYSRTVEEHKVLLDKVFALLKKYKSYVKEEIYSLQDTNYQESKYLIFKKLFLVRDSK